MSVLSLLEQTWFRPRCFARYSASSARVITSIDRSETPASRDEVAVPISGRDHFGALHGISPAMREIFAVLERVAPTDMSVLVGGQTGTGKELVARALHDESKRAKGPFVVLDCGSLPRELAEAAILGHKKGSFTGAVADRDKPDKIIEEEECDMSEP